MQPDTRYALSGGVNIAYQVLGEGPRDLVLVPGWVSNIEVLWEEPALARFLTRLSSFTRLILFDKRGTGLSDRVVDITSLIEVLRLHTEGGVVANGQSVAPAFTEGLSALATHPLVGDVRVRGLLAGVELVIDQAKKTKPPAVLRVHNHLAMIGYACGLIFRAFGDDIIGLAAPLCMTPTETELLLRVFAPP
jgi:pimeloyl-ACP methyl ester carboxylesterase